MRERNVHGDFVVTKINIPDLIKQEAVADEEEEEDSESEEE